MSTRTPKDAHWARKDVTALPQYTTKNVVAYPQDPDAAIRVLCLKPEQLVHVLTVQFVGTDSSIVKLDETLQVDVQRLRHALFWLVTHNWPWLEATKGHGKLLLTNLGSQLEAVLSRYRESLGGNDPGVPSELVDNATPLLEYAVQISLLGSLDFTLDFALGPAFKVHVGRRKQHQSKIQSK